VVDVRTYGGWRRPVSYGFLNLTLTQSLGSLVGVGIVFLLGLNKGMLWACGGAILLVGWGWVITTKDKHQVNLIDRAEEKIVFGLNKAKGNTVFRGGALAPTKKTSQRLVLPGILSDCKVSEYVDSWNRSFALIEHASGTGAVVMRLTPAGSNLVDQETVDNQVAYWGQWLGDLSNESGIAGASITVETLPDLGGRLYSEVTSRRAANCPQVAGKVIEGVLDESTGSNQVRVWVTLTFNLAALGGRKNKEIAGREIASRLPGLTQGLVAAGGGATHLVTVNELARLVRSAYDPDSEELFDQALAAGQTINLDWSQSGPVFAQADFSSYRHDGAVSRVWTMTCPPRGAVQSAVLSRLLEPNRDVQRKRVTILYQPMDAAKAPSVVERDLNHARANAAGARPSARSINELAAASEVASEEASGAGLVDFAMIITATTTPDHLEDTSVTVNALSAASRLLIRPAYGAQDSGFALGLPLGLHPANASVKAMP
jgi:putative membrane protein